MNKINEVLNEYWTLLVGGPKNIVEAFKGIGVMVLIALILMVSIKFIDGDQQRLGTITIGHKK